MLSSTRCVTSDCISYLNLNNPVSRSVLTQLIHSRAFLPFSTVVMALVARLHTLCSVLFDDLLKLAETLVKLIEYQVC